MDKKEILNRVKLLMSYDMKSTLTENYDNTILTEQANEVAKTVAQTFKDVLGTEKGLFQTFKNEIPTFRRFNNADELIKALEGVGKEGALINNAEMINIGKNLAKTPEIAVKLKGMISKSPSFLEIAKKVYPNGAVMGADAKALSTAQNYYKQFGIAEKEVETMLANALQGGRLGQKTKTTKGVNTAKEVEDISKAKKINSVEEVKNLTTQKGKWEGFGKFARQQGIKTLEYLKKLGWRKVLTYGIGGWLLIYLWRNWFTDKPKQWSQCLIDYVGYENFKANRIFDQGSGVLSFLIGKTGVPSLDLAGQLYLRNNGTAKNGDFEGTWECDGNQLIVEFNGEEYPLKKEVKSKKEEKPKKENNGGGTITPTPIRKSQFTECTGTYKQNCKSEVIRKAQGCLGITADGLFGPETKNAVTSKLGRSSFTDADINTICGTTTQTTQPIQKPEELVNDEPSTDEV